MTLHELLADRSRRCRFFPFRTEDGEPTHNRSIAKQFCLVGGCRKLGIDTRTVRKALGVQYGDISTHWDRATDEEQDAIVAVLKEKDI